MIENTHHLKDIMTKGTEMQMINGIPRRARIDLYTPAEAAIRAALIVVESVGAHPLLTDAVILLGQAQEKVADFVEMEAPNLK